MVFETPFKIINVAEYLEASTEAVKNLFAGRILMIQEDLNLGSWKKTDYLEEAYNENSVFLMTVSENEIAGFLIVRLTFNIENSIKEYEEADVLNFGVAERFQKRGVGNQLFNEMLKILIRREVKSIWLEVRESNLSAVKFYLRREFQITCTRKNFYTQPTENGLVMKRNLQKV